MQIPAVSKQTEFLPAQSTGRSYPTILPSSDRIHFGQSAKGVQTEKVSQLIGFRKIWNSLINAFRTIFMVPQKESLVDHELGHLLLAELVGWPAKKITLLADKKQGNHAGVLPNYAKEKQLLQSALKPGKKEKALEFALKEMLFNMAGGIFEHHYYPNFMGFVGTSGDKKNVNEALSLFCGLKPTYQDKAKKKQLMKTLERLVEEIWSEIPLESLRAIRKDLIAQKTINGQKASRAFLKKHLNQNFNWRALRQKINTTIRDLSR